MRLFYFLPVLGAVFLVSCSQSESDKPEVLKQSQTCVPEAKLMASGIVGGSRVNQNDSDSTRVMLLYSGHDTGDKGEICTASAITPRILITAAHCIAGPTDKAFVAYYTSISCESGFDARHNVGAVSAFIKHPEYKALTDFSTSENDIALIILKDAIPLSYATYAIADPAELTTENTIYFLGYGDTGYKLGGAGILRKTQLDRSSYKINETNKKVELDQSHGHGICQGDSGGPGLIKVNGELQILGVNSAVQSRDGKSVLCERKAYLTLVNSYLDWIRKELLVRGEHLKRGN